MKMRHSNYFNIDDYGEYKMLVNGEEYQKDYKTRESQRRYGKKYYERNKDALNEKRRERYQRNRELVRQQSNEYYRRKKTKVQATQKRWLKANDEKIKEYRRNYYLQHREKFLEASRKQRQKQLKKHTPHNEPAEPSSCTYGIVQARD